MATAAATLERTRPVAWQLGAAIICLIALQGWVTLTHDAWLDEWQAMLLAMQSPDLATLSANLRYEGHPPLWYLILKIAGSAATPEWAMRGTAFLIAASTIMIVMLRAPFALWERVAICCGYFMLVEYGSLARGMGLGVMLMFLFVATRNKWLRWAILILFPMIEVQFAVLAVIGAGMMIRDRQWSWAAATALILSMAAMVWLVWPAPDMHPAQNLRPIFFERAVLFFMMFGNLLITTPIIEGQIGWFGNAPAGLGLVAAALFIWLGLSETRRNKWHLLAFGGFLTFTIIMALFIYTLSLRHVGLLAVLLILLAWRAAEAGQQPSRWMRLWLVASSASGLFLAVHIVRVSFDHSAQAAQFVEQNGLKGRLWATFGDSQAVAMTGKLGIPNYNMTKHCLQTFIRWDRKGSQWDEKSLRAALQVTAARYGEFYLVSSVDLAKAEDSVAIRNMVVPLSFFGPGYNSYSYHLFRVASGARGNGTKPPMCPPLDKKSS
jgi:hypothetical protein